jgi:hypothetical protein
MGPAIDIFDVDGGRSWISIYSYLGARCRCFLVFIVGALDL